MANREVVRRMFEAYLAQDAESADGLLAGDFVFTSPQDDHIDKAAFMERCFPTAARFVSHEILELVDVGADGVFVLYEYELVSGGRHRNAEFITVRDGRLTETQVFFGGPVAGGDAPPGRRDRAGERGRRADERDAAADERDAIADERDRMAHLREVAHDQRERVADEREDALDRRERQRVREASKLVELSRDAIARTRLRITRSRHALDRAEAAVDREERAMRRTEEGASREQDEVDRAAQDTDGDEDR